MKLELIKYDLFDKYKADVKVTPSEILKNAERSELKVDYFDFYDSVSSVYSSKIEGEDVDYDSYYKHKFLKVKFKADYTRRADDLFKAYKLIQKKDLSAENIFQAHSTLSRHLLPKTDQGKIRDNIMVVINSKGGIEYSAAVPAIIKKELNKLFRDIETLKKAELSDLETFYFAAYIHLVFVKIHPFQDGNGRTARLLEKWFLIKKLGDPAYSVQSEKNYYLKLKDYYSNLRKLGTDYETLDYTKCLDFLLMTVNSINDGDV